MGTSLLVSEQEYLTTSYEPDCEYDDGELLERNWENCRTAFYSSNLAGFFAI